MALTASSLITSAKKRTYGAQGRQKVSDAMLLEELNYQDNIVVQMISQNAPDLLATVTGTDVVSLAENQSGYTLQAGIHYRDFAHVDPASDTYTPVTIVQRQYQERVLRHPAGMLANSGNAAVFYPVDPDGERWQSAGARTWFEVTLSHEFRYSYVPEPGNLTALSDTLTSPDMAREVLITALQLAIIMSNPEAQEARIQVALSRYQLAFESLRFQAYKFGHPQGNPGSRYGIPGEAQWVQEQVGG